MPESQITAVLLEIGVLLGATRIVGRVLARVRVPTILAGLLVGFAVQPTPFGEQLTSGFEGEVLSVFAELGVLFLLFYVGLQIDIESFGRQRGDILVLTVLSAAFPFVLGTGVALGFGYTVAIALVVGLTRVPTAEAVVVPILEEFSLVQTRVGILIVGA